METFQTDSNFHLVMQPLETSLRLGQENMNLCFTNDYGAMDWASELELDRPVDKNEQLKPDHNVNYPEDSFLEVELCVAASETLVINDIIENDSSVKPSASSVLEASIWMKQARLESWKNTFGCSVDNIGDIDNLSDLDDSAMESAYKDAGIHIDELDAVGLGISQVKDTLGSGCNVKIGSAFACCTIADISTHGMNDVLEKDTQLKNGLVSECFDATKKQLVYAGMDSSDLPKIKVGLSPKTSFCVSANNDKLLNSAQERFQSRWFGGWTWKDEGNSFIAAKHSIPNLYVHETSFFSESTYVPDEKSSVQCSKKRIKIASQISVPSENFFLKAEEGIIFSQDSVKSSCATYFDPLCSVVPCSISEKICSSPAVNHADNVVTASDSDLAQGQGMSVKISDTEESHHTVCRRFNTARNYRTIFPNRTTFLEKCRSRKTPDNRKLIFTEIPFLRCTKTARCGVEPPVSLNEKSSHLSSVANPINSASGSPIFGVNKNNLGHKAFPGDCVRCLPTEIPKWKLLRGKKQSVKCRPASRHLPFLEMEANITNFEKLPQIQAMPKTCSSSWEGKKSNRSSQHLVSRHKKTFMKNRLGEEKRRLIFQYMEFLLTGFPLDKEMEIAGLIQKHGGIVLSHIPSTHLKGKRNSRYKSQVLPIILCLKKVYSVKFLYGCAVNAHLLKANWLLDSIVASSVLPMKKYMIISRTRGKSHPIEYETHTPIFNDMGIMLHGKSEHISDISVIIKHGGGQVFNTLQRMVQSLEAGRTSMGVIVSDNENCASRHLKLCALEKNIPMTSVDWVIKSLYAGERIPLKEKRYYKCVPVIEIQRLDKNMEPSPEF